jgi:hypothetical protein
MTFPRKRPLSVAVILEWLDIYKHRTGRWPNRKADPLPEMKGETWGAVDLALSQGIRGLPGGESITQLLARLRGIPTRAQSPPLTVDQILRWADAYRERHGTWPNRRAGHVTAEGGLTWSAVDAALRVGARGLSGGSSLPRLLSEYRGARNLANAPKLAVEQILHWADAHHGRTGVWPQLDSGELLDAAGETWNAVDRALRRGGRGLPGGSSLARLLAAERGVRNRSVLPRLSEAQIHSWARAHHARTGKWPRAISEAVVGVVGETWKGINLALKHGRRGLPGGSSLAQLLLGEAGAARRVSGERLRREEGLTSRGGR